MLCWQQIGFSWVIKIMLPRFPLIAIVTASLFLFSPAVIVRTQENTAEILQQGIEQFYQGEFANALSSYQQALEIYRASANTIGEAQTLIRIGEVYLNQGKYGIAQSNLQQALSIYQSSNHIAGEGETLNILGRVQFRLGNYQQAFTLHQQALAMATRNRRSSWRKQYSPQYCWNL